MKVAKYMNYLKCMVKLAPAMFFSVALFWGLNTIVLSQESGNGGDTGGGEDSTTGSKSVSRGTTKSITTDVGKANTLCIILPVEYRADCLAQSLRESGRKIRKKSYGPAKNEINSAAKSIDDIVTENLDEQAPVIKLGNKTYRPVKKEVLEEVNQQATKIVVESATRLIRSAGNSVTRKIHFQRIAKALDSTKVLLRSA